MIDKIELDPETQQCRIHYRITLATGVKLASPRGTKEFPAIRAVRRVIGNP